MRLCKEIKGGERILYDIVLTLLDRCKKSQQSKPVSSDSRDFLTLQTLTLQSTPED